MGKRILITGANSYIGTSFENWLKQHGDQYVVDTVDMLDENWRDKDFSGYDTVFHVAGIAHADTGKVSEETKALYYKVNRDLTVETASKAKADGVTQFIFMSSVIVYGSKHEIITKDTIPQPDNFYGDSKLQAEQGLTALNDSSFRVVILRPPMIYGKGSKGNYPLLSKIARKAPFFPDVDNRRSMIYIDNLCEFVRLMVDNEEAGTFFPQNSAYVKTAEMVRLIAEAHGRKIRLFRWMNWAVRLLGCVPGKVGRLVNKAFGSLVYEMGMSEYEANYHIVSLETSIQNTVKQDA